MFSFPLAPAYPPAKTSPFKPSLGKGAVVLRLLIRKPLVISWPFLLHSGTEEKCFILAADSLNTSGLSES